MARQLRCNSCGGSFPDTRDGKTPAYHHVCPEKIADQPEQLDAQKNVVKPATFKATPNPRNENFKPHPQKPGEFVMVSEGEGVTEIE